ncbi:hypothetical protein INR49_032612 [Caranx melampygus]|nr:hypothetical protein INR49_032612 [Caranx melampygus]
MQSIRPDRAILSAQRIQRIVAHRHLRWRLVVKEERYSLHGPQGHLRERRECDSRMAVRRQAGKLPPDQHNCTASVLFKLSQLSGPTMRKWKQCVLTLKCLGSIYQVGPVQGTICPSVRQGHEDRVLQLLPLLLLLQL